MKTFDGPFGSYEAGTMGAVLNAMCEQEGRSCGLVGNYTLGNGKVFKNPDCKVVVCTYVWDGDEIVFTWNAA